MDTPPDTDDLRHPGHGTEGGDARGEGWKLVAQTLAAIVLVGGSVALAGHFYGPALRSLALAFVRHFGLGGFFLGTFLADGFHFPIAPQFYLLAVVSSGGDPIVPLAVICTASIAAGHVAYRVGGTLTRFAFFRRLLARSRGRVDRLFARYGIWAIAVGSVTPVPYSVLCYLSGLYRVDYRLFSLLTLLRIPRLLFFYFLFRWGLRL